MKVLIGVPFHTNLQAHAEAFIKNWKTAIRNGSLHDVTWEIDANGCPEAITDYLKREIDFFYLKNEYFRKVMPTRVTVVSEGGRSHALNRIAKKTLKEGFDAVVYRNDDLIIPKGSLDKLLESLEQKRISSSVAAPTEYAEIPGKKITLVQQSEIYRRHKSGGLDNRDFRGDFFAVTRDALFDLNILGKSLGSDGPFINVHSDDLFLDAWHRQVYGESLESVEGCYSFYEPESSWASVVHRKTRQFEGPLQLAEMQPWGDHITVIKGIDKNLAKFLQAYSAARERAEKKGLVSPAVVRHHPEVQPLEDVWGGYLVFLEKNDSDAFKRLPKIQDVLQVMATLAPWKPEKQMCQISERNKPVVMELVDRTIRLLAASKSEERSIVSSGSVWKRDSQAGTFQMGR